MKLFKKIWLLALFFVTAIFLVGCGSRTYNAEETGIKNDGVFNYKIIENQVIVTDEETGTETTESRNFILIVNLVKQQKDVVIPETIEGFPVKEIADFAFYEYYKLLGLITIPRSKLKTIEFPSSLKKIGKFAFYQARKLESVVLPNSIEEVSDSAFAGANKVSIFTINRVEDEYIKYSSNSADSEPIIITGGRSSYAGDFFRLTASEPVSWESSHPAIAKIDQDLGRITTVNSGIYTITARSRQSNKVSTITMEVVKEDLTKKIAFKDKSMDRLNKLESLVLNVKSPELLGMSEKFLKLNSKAKIYVPEVSVEFYKNHKVFKKYADSILPILEN